MPRPRNPNPGPGTRAAQLAAYERMAARLRKLGYIVQAVNPGGIDLYVTTTPPTAPDTLTTYEFASVAPYHEIAAVTGRKPGCTTHHITGQPTTITAFHRADAETAYDDLTTAGIPLLLVRATR